MTSFVLQSAQVALNRHRMVLIGWTLGLATMGAVFLLPMSALHAAIWAGVAGPLLITVVMAVDVLAATRPGAPALGAPADPAGSAGRVGPAASPVPPTVSADPDVPDFPDAADESGPSPDGVASATPRSAPPASAGPFPGAPIAASTAGPAPAAAAAEASRTPAMPSRTVAE